MLDQKQNKAVDQNILFFITCPAFLAFFLIFIFVIAFFFPSLGIEQRIVHSLFLRFVTVPGLLLGTSTECS